MIIVELSRADRQKCAPSTTRRRLPGERRRVCRLAVGRALSAALVVSIAGLVAVGACQSERETVELLGQARQQEWTRQVREIAGREAALRTRLNGMAAGSTGEGASGRVGQRRAEVLLGGTRQSLADVERSVRQLGSKLDAAPADGPEAERAPAVLEREHVRMTKLLTMLREQLASAEREMARVGRS